MGGAWWEEKMRGRGKVRMNNEVGGASLMLTQSV